MRNTKTIEDVRRTTFMQFAVENLIEDYNESEYESDKYYIQLRFLDFVQTAEIDLSVLLEYMDLQPEKFKPFIKMIEDVKMEPVSKKKRSQKRQFQPQVKVYMYQQGE